MSPISQPSSILHFYKRILLHDFSQKEWALISYANSQIILNK